MLENRIGGGVPMRLVPRVDDEGVPQGDDAMTRDGRVGQKAKDPLVLDVALRGGAVKFLAVCHEDIPDEVYEHIEDLRMRVMDLTELGRSLRQDGFSAGVPRQPARVSLAEAAPGGIRKL